MPNLRFGKWSQGTVRSILQSEALIGHTTIKGVRLERYYPSVISDERYTQLRAKLADNRERKGGGAGSDAIVNLFRNRCRCHKCGGTITTTQTCYYYCRAIHHGGCDARGLVKIRNIEKNSSCSFCRSTQRSCWASRPSNPTVPLRP